MPDMVILVGVDDLESLGELYFGYENLYQSSALVSINSYETAFGNLKLDIMGTSCVSEFVAELLKTLNYQLDDEVATNLLASIEEETDNLQSYLATADTFETVSYLLRNGARRFARQQQTEIAEGQPTSGFNQQEELAFGQSQENFDQPEEIEFNQPAISSNQDDDVLIVDQEAKNTSKNFRNAIFITSATFCSSNEN
jgi:hypothetical protein